LKDPTTNIINKTITIKVDAANITFPKTTSRHFRVGTPSDDTQSPHSLIPWAYTKVFVRNMLFDYFKRVGILTGHVSPKQRLLENTTVSRVANIATTITTKIIPTIAA